MKNTIAKGVLVSVLMLCTFFSYATETKIMVRAKAKDAKFIGSSMGGAYVMVRNAMNGTLLAEGKTRGGSGDTDLLMNTPRKRGLAISDSKTSGFLASVDIEEPTFVQIEVRAPYTHKQAQVSASTQLWLIPGKHILGDGVILEISGFAVDITSPRTHEFIHTQSLDDNGLEIRANVVMMCGCTIIEDGIWDASQMEVVALILKNDEKVAELPMQYMAPNLFGMTAKNLTAGHYEMIVYAYNGDTGNTGVDTVNFILN
ncbi:MAG: hypothetical protein Tsb004_28060 [Allomuricauda sp.]